MLRVSDCRCYGSADFGDYYWRLISGAVPRMPYYSPWLFPYMVLSSPGQGRALAWVQSSGSPRIDDNWSARLGLSSNARLLLGARADTRCRLVGTN